MSKRLFQIVVKNSYGMNLAVSDILQTYENDPPNAISTEVKSFLRDQNDLQVGDTIAVEEIL